MQAVFFYLVYPFIILLASLPFRVLYFLSDCSYYLIKAIGYRRRVIRMNLRNSFPEKSDQEINTIADEYYRYFCDLVFEVLKGIRLKEQDVRERFSISRKDWIIDLSKKNKSIIVVLGHHGNWEWAGPAFSLQTPFDVVGVYRPLANPYFDKLMREMRERLGTQVVPMRQTLRAVIANQHRLTAFALIADQTAGQREAYWTTFLNQDTAVFTGPEKLARRFNYPVIFMKVRRTTRGYYEMEPELLFDNPASTSEGEVTEAFNKLLEREIKQDPAIWLWSHKRWKHKRVGKTGFAYDTKNE